MLERWWAIITFIALLVVAVLLLFSTTMHQLIDSANDVEMRRLVVEKERLLVEQERLDELRGSGG